MPQSKVQNAPKEVAPRHTPRCDIFISYRREGGAELAQLLRKTLHERGYRIFVDVHDMPSGRFDESILDAIFHCRDVIVLLTPGSLERCKQKGDWFRTEIAAAFECGRNIVPLRANGFHMPEAAALPNEIAPLRFQQSVSYSHEHSDAAIDHLCRLLNARPKRIARIGMVIALCLLFSIAMLAAAIFQNRDHPTANIPSLPTPRATITTVPTTEPIPTSDAFQLMGKSFNGTRTGTLGATSPFTLTIGSQSPSGAISGWVTTVTPRGPETMACSGRLEEDGTLFIHYRSDKTFVAVSGKLTPDGRTLRGKYAVRTSGRGPNSGDLMLTRP